MKKQKYVYGVYPEYGKINGDPSFFSSWKEALKCYSEYKELDGCTGATIEKSKCSTELTGKEDALELLDAADGSWYVIYAWGTAR